MTAARTQLGAGKTSWTEAQLRQARLAVLIGAPVPAAMRDYVAGLIPTVASRRRGHPKDTDQQVAERWARVVALDYAVRFSRRQYEVDALAKNIATNTTPDALKKLAARSRRGALAAALKEVGNANNITPEALKKLIAQLRRCAPIAIRTMMPSDRVILAFLHRSDLRGAAGANALLAEPSEGF